MASSKAGQERLAAAFRDECRRRGLASTHQREVIYRIAASRMDHPTPEAIYGLVKREIPSVSLATVYKNLKLFLEAGLIREVTIHHGSLRLDPNTHPHHHLVCERCKSITDVPEDGIEPVRMRGKLPKGFHVERYSVEFIGLCAKCAQRQ
jgi:Fur family peroxide stress response transcriptional regulator